jgi:hypothetical protein
MKLRSGAGLVVAEEEAHLCAVLVARERLMSDELPELGSGGQLA